jgi:hypothetical protein
MASQTRCRRCHLVNGTRFTSQKEIVNHARDILRRNPPGARLYGQDFGFIHALLQKHPRAREKISPGVRGIRVDLNPVWKGQPMFVVVRTNGTETDFSYRKCIRPPSPIKHFQTACRTAVVDDILEFKKRHFLEHADEAGQVLCPLTERLLSWDEVHVDHMPPQTFCQIVAAFIEQGEIDAQQVAIKGFDDGDILKRFADDGLAESFRAFHASVAQLRIIDATEHIRLSK